MKRLLLAALLSTPAFANGIKVSWENPTSRIDGTEIEEGELINAVVKLKNQDTGEESIKESANAVSPVVFENVLSADYSAEVIVVNKRGAESKPGTIIYEHMAAPGEPINVEAESTSIQINITVQ